MPRLPSACLVVLLVAVGLLLLYVCQPQPQPRPQPRTANAQREYYDDNTLAYVALHEAAHTLVPSIGHGRDFGKTFSKLLLRAERSGYYNPATPIDPAYPRSKIPVSIS